MLVAIVLALLAIACVSWTRIEPFVPAMLPKIIWTYWRDHETIPDVVRACMDSWAHHNPQHAIVLLDDAAVSRLTGLNLDDLGIPDDFPARRSDYARLAVVAAHGGTWLDASVVCTRPLPWNDGPYDFWGFTAPGNAAVVENWAFAAPAGSAFVREWYREALRVTEYPDEQAYCDAMIEKHGIERPPAFLPYLTIHLCAVVVLSRDAYALDLRPSEQGPFLYLEAAKWKASDAVRALCCDERMQTPLIKLRGAERAAIADARLARCVGDEHVRRVLQSA